MFHFIVSLFRAFAGDRPGAPRIPGEDGPDAAPEGALPGSAEDEPKKPAISI